MTRRTAPIGDAVAKPIALVVEGEAEYGALPILVRNAGGRAVNPIIFRGQFVSAIDRLAVERIAPRVRLAMHKNVAKVVVVLDREQRSECAPEVASIVAEAVRQSLRDKYSYDGTPPVVVVCADLSMENWLLADAEGLAACRLLSRQPSVGSRTNVDGRDALRALKNACRPGRSYQKRRDAPILAERVRVTDASVRQRSRSLRKFLKEACLAVHP